MKSEIDAKSLGLLREMVASYSARIEELTATLAIAILVDAGQLLIVREADGNERIYGHWKQPNGETVKGWQSSAIIPDNLCGCSMFTHESAARNVAHAQTHAKAGETVFARHYREEQTQRLARYREMHVTLSAKLAEFAPTV